MTQAATMTPDDSRKKAQVFFDRARTIGATGNFDYAIEMFLQGLRLDPECIEAHQALREIGLKRKVNKGKPMGMFEKLRGKAIKDDRDRMLHYEKALAMDPGNTDDMSAMLQAAHKGGYATTAMWVGPILFDANRALDKKQDFNKYILLKDIYKDLNEWRKAIEAAEAARRVKPDDMDLATELTRMAANLTMKEGRYDKDFQHSIKDKDSQVKLMEDDKDVQNKSHLDRLIDEAEAELKASPNEPAKIMKLVDALRKTEEMSNENRAIEILEDAYQRTTAYRFKLAIGDIGMKQLRRMVAAKDAELKAEKDPAQQEALKKELAHLRRDQAEYELKQFQERAEHYPTDLVHRFEAAKRLFALGRFDESIGKFQESTADPKNKHRATLYLGRAFYESQFYDEAVEVLGTLIGEYPVKGDAESKEMYYWRARAYEQKGDKPEAIKHFSQVFMWEAGYRDVQARIRKLRSQAAPPAGEGGK